HFWDILFANGFTQVAIEKVLWAIHQDRSSCQDKMSVDSLISFHTMVRLSGGCGLINLMLKGISLASFMSVPFVHGLPIHNKEVCHENCSCVVASRRGDWLVEHGRNGEPRRCLVSAADEREREAYARNHSGFRRYSKAARSRANALSRIEPTSDPRGSSVFC